MTKGARNINNKDYYFFDNGIQLRNALRRASNGYTYYYGLDGAMVKNAFVDFDDKHKQVRAFTTQGTMVVGNLHWSGHHFYFDRETGIQAKNRVVRTDDGKLHYYVAETGDMGRNVFATDRSTGKRYYFDADGNTVTGSRVIDGKTYYFNQDGSVGTAYSNRADSIIFEMVRLATSHQQAKSDAASLSIIQQLRHGTTLIKKVIVLQDVNTLMVTSITSRKMVAKLRVKLSKKMASNIIMSQKQVFLLADATSK